MKDQASPYRLARPAGFFTLPSCWHWCYGSYERHDRDDCYRTHAAVPSSVEPPLVGAGGQPEPRAVLVSVEVAGGQPVIAVVTGDRADQRRRLGLAEARALAACLLDAADVADGGAASNTSRRSWPRSATRSVATWRSSRSCSRRIS